MRRRCAHSVRRGGILFEIVLALALFGGAAAFALSAVRSVFGALDHTQRRQAAVDIARSRLAELEAGIISLSELRDGETDERSAEQWLLDVRTFPSEFMDLSLIELTVREGGNQADAVSFTLRQLMHVSALDAGQSLGSRTGRDDE